MFMVKLQITSVEDRKLKNKIMARTPYKMKGHELPGPNQKKATTKTKKFYVDNYEANKDKPGFQEAMDKAFGGETRMEGKTSITSTKKSPAKCPLVAALAPMAMQAVGGAVSGAMKKKKEE